MWLQVAIDGEGVNVIRFFLFGFGGLGLGEIVLEVWASIYGLKNVLSFEGFSVLSALDFWKPQTEPQTELHIWFAGSI